MHTGPPSAIGLHENIGLDNVKIKLSYILTNILKKYDFAEMAAIIGFLPISDGRFAKLCI